jgi:hypothetical protein
MYSALVLGCPSTTISPRPGDVEADGDHVRGDGHVHPVVVVERQRQPPLGLGHLVSAHAGGQLDHLVGDLPLREKPLLLAVPLTAGVARQAGAHLVLDDPPAAAQLAEAVEVAEQRHVGVGRVVLVSLAAVSCVPLMRGSEEREVGAQQDDLQATPLGGNAEVEASVALPGGMDAGEE